MCMIQDSGKARAVHVPRMPVDVYRKNGAEEHSAYAHGKEFSEMKDALGRLDPAAKAQAVHSWVATGLARRMVSECDRREHCQ